MRQPVLECKEPDSPLWEMGIQKIGVPRNEELYEKGGGGVPVLGGAGVRS